MLSDENEHQIRYGLDLAVLRQEHADLDAAINMLMASGAIDMMLIQRMKKRKLALKDRILKLESKALPDIIA